MEYETGIFHRVTAAFAAVALTMTILVSYFATPEIQAASAVLA